MLLVLAACFTDNAHLVHQLDAEVVAEQQRVRMLEERLSRCDTHGEADPLYLLVPSEQAEIIDTWDVNGMRGTGTLHFRVTDIFVPRERALPASGIVTTS